MEILSCFLFMFAGGLSFFIYRRGIKDALSIAEGKEVPALAGHREEYVPDKPESDFLKEYSELMNYDFDKAEAENE